MAADRVAAALLVLGNGVTPAGLTPGSLARVRAAVDYVRAGARPARIVFSGGWAQASSVQPPLECREASLMVAAAREAGLDRWADIRAECRSRTTLENLLHIGADGLLDGLDLGPERPLGVVTHAWHLPRVRFLAGKVLGLHGDALLGVPAAGSSPLGEYARRAVFRIGFLGVRDPQGLLRRERRMVALVRRWV
ncbi:YdcF family protein [Actinoplanes sp. NPDC049596]|uniref:YdcF family protein n=1 Tax=unclassified Actinoplanes TaxID=2626549 RepID=UPI003417AA18